MLKKVVFLAGILACLSTPAFSAEGPYLGANIGITIPTDSDLSDSGVTGEIAFDSGLAFGAAMGFNLGAGRIEGEIGYKKANLDKVTVNGFGSGPVNGNSTVLSFLANGYLDFEGTPAVKPFFMAGVGMAKLTIDSSDLGADKEDDIVFAYQAGAGLGVALSKQITVDFSYRYMGTSDADFDGTKATYGSHNLLTGLRFNF